MADFIIYGETRFIFNKLLEIKGLAFLVGMCQPESQLLPEFLAHL